MFWSAKARHSPKLTWSGKFLAISGSKIILDVKWTPPGGIWVVFSPSWRNSERGIQAVQMPSSRTVVARDDVSTIGGLGATITDNQIVLAVSKFLIVGFFNEPRAVHLDGMIVLCSR